MNKQVLLIKGDGIGPEVLAEAHKVLEVANQKFALGLSYETALLGGEAIDATGEACPQATLDLAKASGAVVFGALGGPKWDALPPEQRPEKGLLNFRAGLDLFGNLRPAILYPQLADASTLKPEVVAGMDILIVRELTGGIYFGEPRGVRDLGDGVRQGYNTDVYDTNEIERIGRMAFELAQKRDKRLCSIDKANVLEVTRLWREIMEQLAPEYPDVELSHMYVDNAAMQLLKAPKQFDVMVTGNMFGDILSDEASMLTGSIGMLPSASLNESGFGMYEPCHGSAPDIAGQGLANPLATILSAAMMLKYSFNEIAAGEAIEAAVGVVLDQGLRTADIAAKGEAVVATTVMGDAVATALRGL